MPPRAWGPLCATLLLLLAGPSRAFNVPAPEGYVNDFAGKLAPADVRALDQKLRAYDRQTGNQIVVYVAPSLEGEAPADVAYAIFRGWKIGQRGKDNGVLLLWAPKERQVYIQTGKGVGGDLTDLQSNDIIVRIMRPLLRAEKNAEALDAGTDAIIAALGRPPSGQPQSPQAPVTLPRFFDVCFWGFILFIVVMLLLRSSRHPRRRTYWGGPPFIGGGGWGGGGWGGGGGGGFGGGGDGGGGGFSGGGGDTGGGGSGDSY
jgi:uncharacterized protein